MFTFLLVLLIIDSIVLTTVVLLQAGKGGGLAAMGGGGAATDTLFGGRHAATFLTRLSWWCGGAFIVIAFALSMLSSRPRGAESILQQEFQRGAVPTTVVPEAQPPAGDASPATTGPGEAAPAAPQDAQGPSGP